MPLETKVLLEEHSTPKEECNLIILPCYTLKGLDISYCSLA